LVLFLWWIPRVGRYRRKKCKVCGEEKPISEILGVCRECIIERFDEAWPYIMNAHMESREPYGLPYPPPENGKIICNLCSNMCALGNSEISFCGIRWTKNNKLCSLASANQAVAYIYLDPHVTNCCASWFCPAGTGLGYPEYAVRPGPERGYYNLAVFFYGCNFNCLFCQNAEHKNIREGPIITVEKFVNIVMENPRITCICYFGGSPEPHLPFTIRANREIIERKGGRIIRLCYEWNGAGNPKLVKKAGDSKISIALSGVPNRQTYKNFEMLYHEYWDEAKIPIITATTLLVPGYITPDDIEEIARYIAELNPEIPYSLLIFHPDWKMRDLPITPRKIVYEAEKRARKYLKNVHIGNKFLLATAPENL